MSLDDGIADLHLHTTASDGTDTVEARIDQATKRGLKAIAITDHDRISGGLDHRRSVHGDVTVVSGVVPLVMGVQAGLTTIIVTSVILGVLSALIGLWVNLMGVDALLSSSGEVQAGRHIATASSLFVSFLWVAILSGLAAMGGFILLVVPGIILGLWFSLVAPVMVADGYRGWDALCASREYIRHYTGNAFLRYLGVAVITLVIGWIIQLIIAVVLPGGQIFDIANQVIMAVVNTAIVVYGIAFNVRLYQYVKDIKGDVDVSRPSRGWYMAAAVLGLVVVIGWMYGVVASGMQFSDENIEQKMQERLQEEMQKAQ